MNQINQFKDTYYNYEQQIERLYNQIDTCQDRGEIKRIARELGKLRQSQAI